MSDYPKEQILGLNVGGFEKLVCMDCVREGRDGGTLLREDILLFDNDLGQTKLYFCDYCHDEIKAIDETGLSDEAEAKS